MRMSYLRAAQGDARTLPRITVHLVRFILQRVQPQLLWVPSASALLSCRA